MNRRAFTLIEMVLALAGCAVILAAIYGIFSRAVHLRDEAMARTRDVRVRAHATSVLRNDLRNARISGGTLAATLEGSQKAQSGSFPGYLKFITTTTPDDLDLPSNDLQQVEYYLTADPAATDQKSGLLVRAVDRNLLAAVRETPAEEPLLSGVEAMEVSFYDGESWKESWTYSDEDKTVPEAVRVRLRMSPGSPPLEVLVPWTTQPAIKTPET
jgi:type II secretion system protein J